jgi:hypothetical protein
VDLNAGPGAIEVRDEAGQEGDSGFLQGVRQAVQLPRVEAGVEQDNRHAAVRRGIAV